MSVFLYRFPPYFLRQGFSPNPELYNWTKLVVQQAPGICMFLPYHARVTDTAPVFYVAVADLAFGPCACEARMFLSHLSSLPASLLKEEEIQTG